jgi:polyhydroxybutyrate depolymerase
MRRTLILAWLIAVTVTTSSAAAETFEVGSTKRSYTAIIPNTTPAPLVLVLHGNTQQGDDMRTRTSWPDVATREGFVAVFPDGLNRAWNDLRGDDGRAGRSPPKGTDDVAFLTALVAKFVRDRVADPKRIYVTGVSNGGHMTMTLACTHAGLFAAAASVIANSPTP